MGGKFIYTKKSHTLSYPSRKNYVLAVVALELK